MLKYFLIILNLFYSIHCLCLANSTVFTTLVVTDCVLNCNETNNFIPDYKSCQCVCKDGYNQNGDDCIPLGLCQSGTIEDGNNCIECGSIIIKDNLKIVDGIKAIPNSFPSQIFLTQIVDGTVTYDNLDGTQGEYDLNYISYCGGVLINRYTILTASHCTVIKLSEKNAVFNTPNYPTRESRFRIFLGLNDISFIFDRRIKKPNSVVVARVSKIIDHPEYDLHGNLENDISLLILSNPVDLTTEIQPACLPSEISSTYTGINIDSYLAGWGDLEYEGESPDLLYNVKLTIYDSLICENLYTKLQRNYDKQICAGDIIGNKDSCSGDSGGGLYIENIIDEKLKRTVVGLVSYGPGCGNHTPSIYTRVSYYIDWIKQNWKTQ